MLDEYSIRQWFMQVALDQASDTLNVCKGIVETREAMQPKRKQRSDAGKARAEQQIKLTEPK